LKPVPHNPYAPPQSTSVDVNPSVCWREGKLAVVPHGHDLPPRCVKCNVPAEMDKPRKFAWHHPGWYLFILLNIIVYAVVASLVQKKAKLSFALCDVHRAKRRNFQLVAWALVVVGIGMIVAAIGSEEGSDAAPTFGLTGAAVLLLAIVVGIVGSRVLRPARITSDETLLKGCCSEFLDDLPSAGANPVLRW